MCKSTQIVIYTHTTNCIHIIYIYRERVVFVQFFESILPSSNSRAVHIWTDIEHQITSVNWNLWKSWKICSNGHGPYHSQHLFRFQVLCNVPSCMPGSQSLLQAMRCKRFRIRTSSNRGLMSMVRYQTWNRNSVIFWLFDEILDMNQYKRIRCRALLTQCVESTTTSTDPESFQAHGSIWDELWKRRKWFSSCVWFAHLIHGCLLVSVGGLDSCRLCYLFRPP